MKHHIEFDIEFRENTYPGKFIALEGIDGSGKSTQAPLLVEKLKSKGVDAMMTKEPTSGPIGQFIYKILWGDIKLPPESMQYLFVADRASHEEEIEEHLQKGGVIITDRYFWSSVAYGIVDMKAVGDYSLAAYSILSFYHQFIVPDMTFYLDIDPMVAYERIQASGKKKELYKTPEKLPKIKDGYSFLLEKFPEQFTILKAERSIEEVTEEIITHIEKI
jgi:dTMP kinase